MPGPRGPASRGGPPRPSASGRARGRRRGRATREASRRPTARSGPGIVEARPASATAVPSMCARRYPRPDSVCQNRQAPSASPTNAIRVASSKPNASATISIDCRYPSGVVTRRTSTSSRPGGGSRSRTIAVIVDSSIAPAARRRSARSAGVADWPIIHSDALRPRSANHVRDRSIRASTPSPSAARTRVTTPKYGCGSGRWERIASGVSTRSVSGPGASQPTASSATASDASGLTWSEPPVTAAASCGRRSAPGRRSSRRRTGCPARRGRGRPARGRTASAGPCVPRGRSRPTRHATPPVV